MRIPRNVAIKLKYYVYLYVNPLDGKVFYVGKGKGNRVYSHLGAKGETEKADTIKKIRANKKEPQIEILAHGLKDAKTALRIESSAIDLLGVANLTNLVHGWKSGELGRMPLRQVVAHYQRKPIKVREPAVLIRINRLYRAGMTDTELYDATRSAWKVGSKRDKAKYAFAVHDGIVREVYAITQWFEAGSTFNVRHPRGNKASGRWEFVGVLADEKVRRRYIDRFVGKYFVQGAQNPITYVNVG